MSKNEWVRLTPEDARGCFPVYYRYIAAFQQAHRLDFDCVDAPPALGYSGRGISTAELAAIPAVKALVEAARKARDMTCTVPDCDCEQCRLWNELNTALAALGADAPATVDTGAQVEEG